jgi:threonine synthase
MYFNNTFGPEFNVIPRSNLINKPVQIHPKGVSPPPSSGEPLSEEEMDRFIRKMTTEIAEILNLEAR